MTTHNHWGLILMSQLSKVNYFPRNFTVCVSEPFCVFPHGRPPDGQNMVPFILASFSQPLKFLIKCPSQTLINPLYFGFLPVVQFHIRLAASGRHSSSSAENRQSP